MIYKLTSTQIAELKTITSTATNKFFRPMQVMSDSDFTVNHPEQKAWFDANVTNLKKHFNKVKPMYFRLSLLQLGMLDAVEAGLTGADKIAFEYALEFDRYDPMVVSLAPQFGLTAAQVDALFDLAISLQNG